MASVRIGKEIAKGLSGKEVLEYQKERNDFIMKFAILKIVIVLVVLLMVIITAVQFPQTQSLFGYTGGFFGIFVSVYKIVAKFKY